MKVRVVSELTAFRKKSLYIYCASMLFCWCWMIFGFFTDYYEGAPVWLVILVFLVLFLLGPFVLLENVFYILTIGDDYLSISMGAERKLPKKNKTQ